MPAHPALPPPEAQVVLRSPTLEVVVLPESGADIYSVTHRESGVDVLWKTPWGWRDPRTAATFASSEDAWLARCAGGWSTLVPNAGAERAVAGSVRGYHGEAAVSSWTVLDATASSVRLSVSLLSAPLRLERTVSVSGGTVHVQQEITNLSRVPVEVSWVEHPAFGADFLGEGAELDLPAAAFRSDPSTPGTDLVPGIVAPLDQLTDSRDRPFSLREVPGSEVSRALFGSLTELSEPSVVVRSPQTGLEVGLTWQAETFPCAWVWQECHSTAAHPWYRAAYAVAVEPANLSPGGPGVEVAPGATITGAVSLTCRRTTIR